MKSTKNLIKENKKKVVISTITIILVAIIGTSFYFVYKQNEERKIQEYVTSEVTKIEKNYKDFEGEEDRVKKIEQLKTLISETEKYEKESKSKEIKGSEEVIASYKKSIKSMKDYFVKGYDETISNNTLEEVEKITDKGQLSTAKGNLENLLATIKSEEAIVLDKKDIKTYEEKINSLIDSYNKRIEAIEKEEAEKAAEEARKAEEQATAKKKNSSKNNSSSSSNKNSSSSSNKGSKNWKDGLIYHCWFDENGVLSSEWYEDPITGQRYDMNGNKISGNWQDWAEEIPD